MFLFDLLPITYYLSISVSKWSNETFNILWLVFITSAKETIKHKETTRLQIETGNFIRFYATSEKNQDMSQHLGEKC